MDNVGSFGNVVPISKVGHNPFEDALERLVEIIRSGQLSSGDKLPPERQLSEDLSVSRTTLRAVIRALQQAGYVRTERGRSGGSYVIWRSDDAADQTPRLGERMAERLLDVTKFRSVLEPGAAAMAAARTLTSAERAELEILLDKATTNSPGFRIADAELHTCIARLSGCHALVESIADAQLILNETLLQVVPFIGTALDHSHEQHRVIVSCILSGDEDGARSAMADHVGATAALIRTFLGSPLRG